MVVAKLCLKVEKEILAAGFGALAEDEKGLVAGYVVGWPGAAVLTPVWPQGSWALIFPESFAVCLFFWKLNKTNLQHRFLSNAPATRSAIVFDNFTGRVLFTARHSDRIL